MEVSMDSYLKKNVFGLFLALLLSQGYCVGVDDAEVLTGAILLRAFSENKKGYSSGYSSPQKRNILSSEISKNCTKNNKKLSKVRCITCTEGHRAGACFNSHPIQASQNLFYHINNHIDKSGVCHLCTEEVFSRNERDNQEKILNHIGGHLTGFYFGKENKFEYVQHKK